MPAKITKRIHGTFLRCSSQKTRSVKIERLKKVRDLHKAKMAEASAALKILYDQEASAKKKQLRSELNGQKSGRGRRSRWSGNCLACLMRFLGEDGGPAHDKSKCNATTKIIAASPKWVKKKFGKQ